ncbi:AIR synthase-related protein [Desulfovibrio subterraneus]|uniref:Phosphoribosylformylglycinamidine synthase subunit PurL n=1 Tax=Desulfovibrio subterraneus TaxID=2718620 RepID=A0A7J0BMY4_9BACT|nr:AIR synthase-related protein [Desulfovibrio subterraneus]GFM34552.1 phosphoribosylformylglycinamidine synthase II [Desulfovibrio subterraneus]
MLRRIEVGLRAGVVDTVGRKTAHKIKESLGLDVADVRLVKVFTVDGLDDAQVAQLVEAAGLHDPVLQEASITPVSSDADWVLEVGFRPGVTDNEGRTARETIAIVLGLAKRTGVSVFVSNQYHIYGKLTEAQVDSIGRDLLANELIQRYEYVSGDAWRAAPGFKPFAARVSGQASSEVAIIPFSTMTDEQLVAFSRENTLALSLEELHTIRDYYTDSAVREARAAQGLPADPTDAEIEALAQTWSEHCKHKIFSSRIDYTNAETGKREVVDNIYKTFIQGSTKTLRERMGKDDFCRSVFKDNAGVIAFNDTHDVCIKVETHNSPSALDPYGGALTGIVGVNRDPMGTGMGANMVCNTNVFCFASPFHEGELPPRLLHPQRVLEGVREGVEHGGNKSGVPTVNGSIVFEDRYLGKPLVYCGTVGLMPKDLHGKPGHYKKALVGDIIVMAGGRIGKDGIHGATFSSEELHEESPATAVQIGDPITQRKMYDFIMRARDKGLYNAITDNGAGGLSSSVGEMSEDTGGFRMDLSKAPLKYDGLRPWEILLSEAQERMTLAVPTTHIDEFMQLAGEMDVEATALGEFTDSGYFHVTYGDKPVAFLSMDFLHDGVPQMQLKAEWKRPVHADQAIEVADADQGGLLKTMLGRLNICSKEYVVRQYDHEVKGGSVIKPMVGVKRDGPSDAGVVRPRLESEAGIVLSHGICPRYSDYDAYWMMANAIDEAVRNAVAVGGDLRHMGGCDNFCWCDPVQSEKTPDGHYKLAQLVRANQALAHFCLAYGVPCVSGKDSMKNDYTGGGVKISIPPTVLFSVMGVIKDVNKTTTSDFKKAGDRIYMLGATLRELGGSELIDELKLSAAAVPQVDALAARTRYLAVHEAITSGLVNGCHDCSDGGMVVALAEMALAGRLGASVDLDKLVTVGSLNKAEALYSESASRLVVTVPAAKADAFEALFKGQHIACLGEVTDSGLFTVTSGSSKLISENVEELAKSFKGTLQF